MEIDLPYTLRTLRRERGLTLGELAHRAGVSVNSIQGWESGRQLPKGRSLSRTLEALGAPERTRARLVAQIDPRFACLSLARTPLGPPLGLGTVLRAMRVRRGVTQVELATAVGVTQGAVAKWENGDSTPSPTTLHEAAFALGATVEEALALASAQGDAPDGLPDEPGMVYLPYSLSIDLREALAFAYEAELWRRAACDPRWEPALCGILGWRANLYALDGRHAEIPDLANRALRLATTPEAREAAVPAVNALTEFWLHRGDSPAKAARVCGDWAEPLPSLQHKAWMLSTQALNVARHGGGERAVEMMQRARDVDEEFIAAGSGEAHALGTRAESVAEVALEGGLPRVADRALESIRHRDTDLMLRARVEHANGRPLGEEALAAVREWVRRPENHDWKRLRRLDSIERAEAALVGEA